MRTEIKSVEKFWFEEDDSKKAAILLFETHDELKKNQSHKYANDLEWYRLYSNHNLNDFTIDRYTSLSANAGITFNVVQSITDTVSAKIGKNKPKITFLTDDGNWALHMKAKKLEKFIDTEFSNSKVYDVLPRSLKVGCVFGSGLVKCYEEDLRPAIKRVLPHQVAVDDRECIEGDPRTFYEETYISKFVLKSLHPNFEYEIEKATTATGTYFDSSKRHLMNQMVKVIEGWRLPSRKGAGDGRHIIAISECSLVDEGWDKPYFPFAKIDFSDRILGYWGIGIPELIRGIQLNMNRILNRITKSIDIGAVHRIWLEYTSKVVSSQISNETGSVHYYAGTPPIFSSPSVVPPECFNQLDRLFIKAYEMIGASQLSASSAKPAGLNAMVAIREYHDIETERFSWLQTSYDNAHLKVADMYIDIIDNINRREQGGYSSKVKTPDGYRLMKWKEVSISEEDRIIEKYPTNLLPQQPSGRLDKAIELTQSGFFSREESLSLLDYPDIKSITSLKTAKLDDIMLTIDLMVEQGKYIAPQAYQDLRMGIEYCQAYYLKYKHRGVPEKNLNLLLDWINQAGTMIETALAAQQPTSPEQQIQGQDIQGAMPSPDQLEQNQVPLNQAKMINNYGEPIA